MFGIGSVLAAGSQGIPTDAAGHFTGSAWIG
jgi:cytochrome d ubiquinol oxidase subunit II